ncbi:hypothetical protein ANCCEY_03356 [Ancylostoma ceylanicum]|nr:hypothetical protein ANCCEY_03356 [Ancylostoma ceylanicum]
MLGSLVSENLQVVDSFGHMPDQLMHDVLRETVVEGNQSIQNESHEQSNNHPYETGMLHSASSTSVESLSGYSGSYSYNNSSQSQGLPYNLSSNSLPSTMSNYQIPINATSSMPNLDQMPECDPDYNITLTPDMYCG